MKFPILILTAGLLSANQAATAQSKSAALVSGPMLGHISHRTAGIWLEAGESVKEISIRYWPKGKANEKKEKKIKVDPNATYHPSQVQLEALDMNQAYVYEIRLDGKVVNSGQPQEFKTRDLWEWRKPAPDFTFLIGSCAYINDSLYDRPSRKGPYGQSPAIFESMGKTQSDFMLWLGDNVYYREADLSSVGGMRYRYSHDRAIPEFRRLLATRPNYAIWDDHDFGPNDANRAFALKDTALSIFKQYWVNPYYGTAKAPGAYTHFSYSDCDFFLLDDRTYRSPENLPDSANGKPNLNKPYFGAEQLLWLKENLLNSRAPFKFIVSGNQILNANLAVGETMSHYSAEKKELLDYIKEFKINGVLFLTGDRHFTELIQAKPDGMYRLLDYTSSPLTSTAYTPQGVEATNPDRVDGSMYNAQNFGQLTVTGERGKRKLNMKTLDRDGKTVYEFSIGEEELKFSK